MGKGRDDKQDCGDVKSSSCNWDLIRVFREIKGGF